MVFSILTLKKDNIMNLFKLVYLTLLVVSFSTFPKTIIIDEKNIHESYSETVKVSGSFFLGLQFKGGEQLGKLNILFPQNSIGFLCIDISSIDGRYKASIEHSIDSPISGLNQLDFPSKHQTELNSYKPNELAVKSRIGKSCKENKKHSLISSWSNSIKNNNVVLLIRSDARKDVVYVPDLPNEPKKFKCKKFKNEYKVTYDKYCELKDVDLTSVTYITIKRKNLQKIPDEIIKLAYK